MNFTMRGLLTSLFCAASLWAQDIQHLTAESSIRSLTATEAKGAPHAIQLQGVEFVVPELIIGGEWTTTIRLTNRGSTTIPTTNVYFFDNNGSPMAATFQITGGSVITDVGFSFFLNTGGIVEATFIGTSSVRFGFGTIACNSNGCRTPGLYGEATLRNRNATRPDFESVFPLEYPSSAQYMLFDGRAGVTTVLYLVNSTTTAQTVNIDVYDVNNRLLRTIPIPMQQLTSLILSLHADLAPETVGIQGTLGIRSGSTLPVTITGLRINPSNSFSTMRAFIPSN
jgi:hypothetical protein